LRDGIIQEAAARVSQAVDGVLADYRAGNVEQEPAITDRMLQAMATALNGHQRKGFVWTAKTFTDRGHGSQESRVGADFMGVLAANLPTFEVTKGFLAQAKRLERDEELRPSDLSKLKEQCDAMLAITPDAFVFLYSRHQVTIVPAVSVAAFAGGALHKLHQRKLTEFIEEHLACFIGDRSLGGGDEASIRRAMEAAHARVGLSIAVKPATVLRR
jgi:hypothetical protein